MACVDRSRVASIFGIARTGSSCPPASGLHFARPRNRAAAVEGSPLLTPDTHQRLRKVRVNRWRTQRNSGGARLGQIARPERPNRHALTGFVRPYGNCNR